MLYLASYKSSLRPASPTRRISRVKSIASGLGSPPELRIDPEQDHWPPNYYFGVKSCTLTEHLAVKAALSIPAERPTVEVFVVNLHGCMGTTSTSLGHSPQQRSPLNTHLPLAFDCIAAVTPMQKAVQQLFPSLSL